MPVTDNDMRIAKRLVDYMNQLLTKHGVKRPYAMRDDHLLASPGFAEIIAQEREAEHNALYFDIPLEGGPLGGTRHKVMDGWPIPNRIGLPHKGNTCWYSIVHREQPSSVDTPRVVIVGVFEYEHAVVEKGCSPE